MEIMTTENKRLMEYGMGGILGLVAVGYLAPYMSSNIYELIGGAVILGGTLYFIRGTEGWKGPIKLLGVVVGTLFAVRGLLGFIPGVKSVVDQYTLNIL